MLIYFNTKFYLYTSIYMSKNRGMLLESLINKTIDMYRVNDIGLFHKKEVPINFAKIIKDKNKLRVENAYIKSKSTLDYYGVYNGHFVAFEAKSTKLKSLPFQNIKEHQLKYMKNVVKHGGISFFILGYQKYDEFFLFNYETLESIENKSISIEDARRYGFKLDVVYPGILDFVNLI